MMMPGPEFGLVVGLAAAVLTVHWYRHVEEMRSREKAQDEPTSGQVVNILDVV
jgi:hypothetical protein